MAIHFYSDIHLNANKLGRDADNLLDFSTDNEITFRVGAGDGVIFKASGEIEATKFDGALEGNADTATALASARTIGGVSFDGTANIILPGVNAEGNQNTTGNAATASKAAQIIVNDNESTAEENQITFIAGAAGGSVSTHRDLEADGDLTYNPSTGTLSSTIFKGNIDAVDGDFDGTLEADAITIGSANILTGGIVTTLGTITQDTVTFTSANADDPAFILQNTTNDAQAVRLQFKKNRGAAGQDGDNAGEIEFYSYNDAGTPEEIKFGNVVCEIHDATDGEESGQMLFQVANHDGGMQTFLKATGGDVNNEIDVEIGRGAASVTAVQGTMSVVGNATLAGFILDGNTITGVDDSGEFTDNDNHIMTSAGINDKFAVISRDTTGVDDYQSTDFQDQAGMTAGHGRTLKYSPGSSSSLTVGQIYYLATTGIWEQADADTVGKGATQLLGVGLGAPRTNGVFMEGFIQIPATEILNVPGSGAVDGLPLYVSTTDGHFDFTAPSGSADYVRIVGYAVDDFTEESNTDVLVYFCPSKDHILLA